MVLIIFITAIIGIIGLIFIWEVYKIIKGKSNGETLNLKKIFIKIGSLILIGGFLGVYDIYLVASLVIDNKDEILDQGQNAISKTVEYGATAVFEGFGGTIDHFEEKWDKKYSEQLTNVSIAIQAVSNEKENDKNDKVVIDLVFDNRNLEKDRLNLSFMSDNNYLLIGDKNKIYYPVTFVDNQNTNYLPSGKTVLKVQGIVPKGLEVKYVRLFDKIEEIK